LSDVSPGPIHAILRGHGADVTTADFADVEQGTCLVSRDREGQTLVWDLKTGQALPDVPAPPDTRPGPISADGRFQAELRGRAIWLMDLRREPPLWVSRPALGLAAYAWHAEQAVRAERAKQWFAVGFHLEQQVRERPWDIELRKREAHAWRTAGQDDRAARAFVPMMPLGLP
jgi:hypothetical protein